MARGWVMEEALQEWLRSNLRAGEMNKGTN